MSDIFCLGYVANYFMIHHTRLNAILYRFVRQQCSRASKTSAATPEVLKSNPKRLS